jgi:hypothetical protein
VPRPRAAVTRRLVCLAHPVLACTSPSKILIVTYRNCASGPGRAEAAQGRGESSLSLLGAISHRRRRFHSVGRSPGGPAWAGIFGRAAHQRRTNILIERPTASFFAGGASGTPIAMNRGWEGPPKRRIGFPNAIHRVWGTLPRWGPRARPTLLLKPVLAEGHPLVPGSAKSFPGTQGLPEILRGSKSPGPVQSYRAAGTARFAFPLNRLFSLLDLGGTESPRTIEVR